MKLLIDKVTYKKEFETKFGIMHQFNVAYYDEEDNIKTASYSSKKKDQTYFVAGQESECTLEPREWNGKTYFNIKPVKQGKFSGYNKNLKKEQSRYSGFAVSYCKDLIVADKLDIKQWKSASKDIFDFMVELDKSIEDDNS
jgi:hypothetical protein